MRSPSPPARRTAIFRTPATSSGAGRDGMVDDLSRRYLVEEFRTVAEAEAARLPRLGGPARRAAEDRVDLDRPDRELARSPLRVLRVRSEHCGCEPVDRLVCLLQSL